MKISFRGKSSSRGFIYLTAILMLVGISFVLIGLNSLLSAKYKLVSKQSEQFYSIVEENNRKVMEEK